MSAVIISGVSGGIGQAIAKSFSLAGFRTIGLDIRPAQAGIVDEFFEVDLSKSDSVIDFCSTLTNRRLALRCLVNCAAQMSTKSLVETSLTEWRQIQAVNLESVFILSTSLSELLRGGSIVNISSVHSKQTSIGAGPYAASKGGLNALTRALAIEFAELGIRVNAILPGAIDTEMLSKGLSRALDPSTAREQLVRSAPLQRIGTPSDVAELVLFLADSQRAANITGQEFVCDGGVLARLPSE